MKWTPIEEGFPTKEGIYAVKYKAHHNIGEEWATWNLAIWNGKGFNHLRDEYGRKIKAWVLLWSNE